MNPEKYLIKGKIMEKYAVYRRYVFFILNNLLDIDNYLKSINNEDLSLII